MVFQRGEHERIFPFGYFWNIAGMNTLNWSIRTKKAEARLLIPALSAPACLMFLTCFASCLKLCAMQSKRNSFNAPVLPRSRNRRNPAIHFIPAKTGSTRANRFPYSFLPSALSMRSRTRCIETSSLWRQIERPTAFGVHWGLCGQSRQ